MMYRKLIIAFLVVLSVVTYVSSHNSGREAYRGNVGHVIKV